MIESKESHFKFHTRNRSESVLPLRKINQVSSVEIIFTLSIDEFIHCVSGSTNINLKLTSPPTIHLSFFYSGIRTSGLHLVFATRRQPNNTHASFYMLVIDNWPEPNIIATSQLVSSIWAQKIGTQLIEWWTISQTKMIFLASSINLLSVCIYFVYVCFSYRLFLARLFVPCRTRRT